MAVFAGGLAALVLGVIGLFVWGTEFVSVLKGIVPVMLVLGGGLAAYLGYEEIKDKNEPEIAGEPDEDLKKEVASLKEEIKGLKEEKKE